ncbi:MAG TPA: glycoside hydrolase family 36 protein, partial [Anaerolineae bacterium]
MLSDRVNLDPLHGTLDFLFHGQAVVQNATAFATYRDVRGAPHRITLGGNPVTHDVMQDRVTIRTAHPQPGHPASEDAVELTWNAVLGEESYLWLEVINRSREPIQVDELHVLSLLAESGATLNLKHPPPQWRFFQNGWQSWSAAFARVTEDGIHADPNTQEYRIKHLPHAIPSTPKTMSSEWFTVVTGGGETSSDPKNPPPAIPTPALLLGFVTTADQLGEIRLQLDKAAFISLDAITFADGARVEPGESLASEKLLLMIRDDPLGLLESYATRLGETMHARIPASPLTGWCTWYYFFGENTERDVIANLERIRAERLPLDLILIDDGYQTADGDWTSVNASKFPQGMKWLAGEIKRAGHTPALWLAPFAANENSKLAHEHPEFLLRDTNGEPVCAWQHWGAKCFSLDLTRADVQTWLGELFHTLSDEWGYELFKLDFTYIAAAPGVCADPRMTRAQALRRGFEIIREAVGDKKLLGCGAPFGPSVGLIDAMRIGPDVSINWEPFFQGDPTEPSTAYALRNTLTRAFLHNRLWQNDPDCVLVRRRDDESALVLNEMRTMVSIIGLSGGAVLSSDNLPSIRRGRLKYLKQILPPTGRTARAIDLFQNELPRLFVLPIDAEWAIGSDHHPPLVVGSLNWSEKTRQTEIDLETLGLDPQREYHVYNYWHRRYLGTLRGHIQLKRHQPHETRVLLFKAVSDQVE